MRSEPRSFPHLHAPCPLSSLLHPSQVHKLLIVVELLLGEIPDRLQFRQPSLKRSLMPYFLLTQGKAALSQSPALRPGVCAHLHQLRCSCLLTAVRTGNLAKFNQVLDQFGEKFQTDGTYTLIIRLRHNVIKTGVALGLNRCRWTFFPAWAASWVGGW